MAIGVIGTKSGMTRVFTDAGESVPVTVIVAPPNRVTQVKTQAVDGYDAVQVTAGKVRSGRVSRPLAGHFSKANAEAGRGLWEFRLDGVNDEFAPGAEIGVEQFEKGQIVDVAGVSKGKGFAGAIKRWNFRSQDASHGNSVSHRAPGSIGQCQTPGRVFKGKKMAGQLGNRRVTVQNLTVVDVVPEKHLLLIKGAVPGAPGADICVRPATKRRPAEDAA